MPDASPDGLAPMHRALAEARAAAARGEVPVGAVVVHRDGRLLAAAGNEIEARADASAHAEMLAMRAAAARLGHRHLSECVLVSSLEPCAMCAAAAGHFRIGRIVFGAWDPKGGAIDHGPRLFARAAAGGCLAEEAEGLLKAFFAARR